MTVLPWLGREVLKNLKLLAEAKLVVPPVLVFLLKDRVLRQEFCRRPKAQDWYNHVFSPVAYWVQGGLLQP